MKIAATQYSIGNLALEIYVSGCDGHCKGCHNPELLDFSIGNDYRDEIPKIMNKVKEFDSMIRSIWIEGGEPLLQDHNELIDLLIRLKEAGKSIVLFTRFELSDVPEDIRKLCVYIKTGAYDETLKVDDHIMHGIRLASSNQSVYKV